MSLNWQNALLSAWLISWVIPFTEKEAKMHIPVEGRRKLEQIKLACSFVRKERINELGQAWNIMGGATMFMVILAVYGWWGMPPSGTVAQLSVERVDELKEVLYGGQPWMVLCDARPVSELFAHTGKLLYFWKAELSAARIYLVTGKQAKSRARIKEAAEVRRCP